MELQGSKSEHNLLAAFAGESQARNRYTFFASAARKEGYEQIAGIFRETAANEKEHAELFFKQLEGGNAQITAEFPAGVIGKTLDNLKAAAEGEHLETTQLYPNAGKIAESEGFKEVADVFRQVGKVEAYHERRYRKLAGSVENGAVFKKDSRVHWHCRNCGHVIETAEVPASCPVCDHAQSYFELWCENY
jgi:rubrerythrin